MKGTFIQRMAAKIVAKMLLKTPDATHQVFGEPWGTAGNCVFERNTSTAQRILRTAGYSVTEYDLMTAAQKEQLIRK